MGVAYVKMGHRESVACFSDDQDVSGLKSEREFESVRSIIRLFILDYRCVDRGGIAFRLPA